MRASRAETDVVARPRPEQNEAPTPSPKPQAKTEASGTTARPSTAPTPQPSPERVTRRPPPKPTTAMPTAPAREKPQERAPIIIEKIGEAEEEPEEVEPQAPPPKQEQRGWWIFGKRRERDEEAYRFLTPSIRREINRPKIRRGRWKYIVVHNSGSRNGNARIFDYYHRRVRKMRNGMAYHFVIGNGNASPNGRIEIGDRWRRQINGGHVASDYLNDIAIGICLVGDFNNDLPTENQLRALSELTEYLRQIAGNKRRRTPIIRAHRDINPKPTDCPGDRWMRTGWLKRKFY